MLCSENVMNGKFFGHQRVIFGYLQIIIIFDMFLLHWNNGTLESWNDGLLIAAALNSFIPTFQYSIPTTYHEQNTLSFPPLFAFFLGRAVR
jgi:hypothetical protein